MKSTSRPFAASRLPDIVHFRSACGGTEIFLRELALLNTLSSNPKSSRSVGLVFSHKLLFYFL